jgi:hypothetical protein
MTAKTKKIEDAMLSNEAKSNQTVNLAIGKVAATGKAFSLAVQSALLAIHAHKTEFGDWSGFKRLLEVMPKGARSNSVKAWIEQTTNVRFGKGKDVAMDRNVQDTPYEEAKKLNWEDADGAEKAYKGLNWKNQAEKILEKFQSDVDHSVASIDDLLGLISGLQTGLEGYMKTAKQAQEAAQQLESKAA